MQNNESKECSKMLRKCPFCGEELELHCTSRYYMHKLNGCILQHFCFEADDELYIDLWNTREPMDIIVERLEVRKGAVVIDGKVMYQEDYFIDIDEAIEIVKQEGGLNERDS